MKKQSNKKKDELETMYEKATKEALASARDYERYHKKVMMD